MEGDLANQCDVCSGHLNLCGEKNKVGNGQVKRGPGEENEAESSERAKVPHDEGEEPQLSDHGVHTLHSKHETDSLSLKTKTTSELEGQGDGMIRFGRTEEYGHQLVERNTVAMEYVSNDVLQLWLFGYQKW